jgi:hypothetical protein
MPLDTDFCRTWPLLQSMESTKLSIFRQTAGPKNNIHAGGECRYRTSDQSCRILHERVCAKVGAN